MKVYIVTQSWGCYSEYTEAVIGVVSSIEKAKKLSLEAEPVAWENSFIEVECFQVDGTQQSFSKAEREAYKYSGWQTIMEARLVLNELEAAQDE